MKSCPQCGRSYTADDRFCTVDGATLVAADGNAGTSLVGTVLADRYLVQQRLGEGGMGEVYLAEHVRIKRKVAVKVMRSWMANDPIAISRFHREAENASQISHPNVAQVYDFGETADGTIYLAMEFVPGEPLSALLDREGHLHTVRAAELVRQTAEALVAAHAMGILHRDLKPDNIMVARTRAGTDVIKLVDFGIARVMNSGSQQFTSTGMILGTPDYMSPEQLTGDPLDERSDIYALALIAFRVLTGHSAFTGGGTGDVLLARLMNRPASLAEVRPEVPWPAALQDAFSRALHSDPAVRHGDALEFAAELDGAIATLPLTDEEQAYLVLLSQRLGTPSRGGMVIEALTPVRSMAAIDGDSGHESAPGTRGPSSAVATPPSESRSLSRATVVTPALPGGPDIEDTTPAPPVAREPGPVTRPSSDERAWMPAPPASTGHPHDKRTAADVPSTAPSGAFPAAAPDVSLGDAPTPRAPQHTATVASSTGAAGRPGGRRAMPLLVGAVVAAAAVAYAAWRPRESASPQVATAAVARDSLEVAGPPLQDSAEALPVANASDDSARVQRARSGVLAFASGRGTALVVDSTGLLLTAASLVPGDQATVDLFVDAEHRARATVVARDAATGIAVLRLHPTSCRRCRPLELARGDSGASTVGDTLLALAVVRRMTMAPQSAVVASASSTALTTATPLAASLLGAPLFDPQSGLVAGLVTRRGGGVGVATTAVLRRSIAAGRTASATAALNDTLYRTWPLRAVPAAELQRAEDETPDLTGYRVQQGGYDVLAMTPQLLAWRVAKSAPPPVEDNPFAIPAAAPVSPADPLLEWGAWRAYRDERRAVVVLMISPDKAAYPELPAKPLDARKGDVLAVTVTRDGTPLVPLERQRIPAVGNLELYRREKKAIPNAAVYVFHPADFAPSGAYQLDVIDADPKRRTTIALPAALLQAIARDLSPWQR